MKLKRILPILLLLSMCVGLLTGCSLVAAEEPPIVTQEQAPATEGKTEDDGIFTITDDERMGEVFAKILNGEMVIECFDDNQATWTKSNLYVTEYMMGVLKQLNTIAVEPITYEEFEKANAENNRPAKYVLTAQSLSEGFVTNVMLGGNYVAFYFYAQGENMRSAYFKTEQNLNEMRNEIQKFWNAEGRAPFHGIANSGKVGKVWRKYMLEDTVSTDIAATHKIIIRDGKTSKILSTNDIANDEREAFWDIYRKLENIVVAELEDVCECCDDTWALENELNSLRIGGRLYYGGMHIRLYNDGIKISNHETGEVAYFSVAEGSTQEIHDMIVELLKA